MKRIIATGLIVLIIGLMGGCSDETKGKNDNESIADKEIKNEILETNTEQLIHYMNNKGISIPSSIKENEELIQYETMATLMSQWIEALSGKTIDVSNFSELYRDQYTSNILKMFKLNIFSPYDEVAIESNVPIIKATAVQSMLAFANFLDGSVYKSSKDLFIGEDLKRYYEYMLIVYKEDSKNKEKFVDSNEILSQLGINETQVITKKIFADFFVFMREATVNLVEDTQRYNPTVLLEDDDDVSVQALLMLNVYRPGQAQTIRPEHELTHAEFAELLERSLPYWNTFNKEDDSAYYINNEEVAELLVAIYEQTAKWESQDKTESLINNGVDYDWYVSQLDTGENAIANCLPADIAMIGRWYDESFNKTVQAIRKNNIKSGEAWTMTDAQDEFVRSNIRYEKNEASIESLIQIVDEGGIALVAIDTQLVGHVVIVKGYERRGEDIYLQIYDPAVGDTPDEYGQPMGAHVIEHTSLFEYKMKQANEEILTFFKS